MFEKQMIKSLIAIAEAFAEATGRTLTAISKEFYGRADFFDELSRGTRTISIRRFGEMLTDFRAKWPRDKRKSWPKIPPIVIKINSDE